MWLLEKEEDVGAFGARVRHCAALWRVKPTCRAFGQSVEAWTTEIISNLDSEAFDILSEVECVALSRLWQSMEAHWRANCGKSSTNL